MIEVPFFADPVRSKHRFHRQEFQQGRSTKVAWSEVSIVFVDVVEFSALMSQDEIGVAESWLYLRENILRPELAAFGGVFVKSTGDGILATFEHPREAVRWARQVQSEARRARCGLSFRVSVHHAPVLRDGTDLIGEGVNIAARLQELAEPGGLIVSQPVHDALAGDMEFSFQALGHLQLKHIPTPVAAYAVRMDGRPSRLQRNLEAHLPSIAVLPFRNLGGSPEDDYFAEGVVEDIIVSLSRLGELLVVERSSTLAVSRALPGPREVGRALGVRYVLGGALQRAGGSIRVSAHLHDAGSGATLFSEHEEFRAGDLFQVQDRIVELA
ncbi:MAG TPA: adenylate/guanylate cyclase domain-containing protein, partial [Paracoccaceae bacterium]|nr:adenylate/guanylate cyclase domain-containing protein [Paracoccaceae bacterium]